MKEQICKDFYRIRLLLSWLMSVLTPVFIVEVYCIVKKLPKGINEYSIITLLLAFIAVPYSLRMTYNWAFNKK